MYDQSKDAKAFFFPPFLAVPLLPATGPEPIWTCPTCMRIEWLHLAFDISKFQFESLILMDIVERQGWRSYVFFIASWLLQAICVGFRFIYTLPWSKESFAHGWPCASNRMDRVFKQHTAQQWDLWSSSNSVKTSIVRNDHAFPRSIKHTKIRRPKAFLYTCISGCYWGCSIPRELNLEICWRPLAAWNQRKSDTPFNMFFLIGRFPWLLLIAAAVPVNTHNHSYIRCL